MMMVATASAGNTTAVDEVTNQPEIPQ
jgi:hypothetical protein